MSLPCRLPLLLPDTDMMWRRQYFWLLYCWLLAQYSVDCAVCVLPLLPKHDSTTDKSMTQLIIYRLAALFSTKCNSASCFRWLTSDYGPWSARGPDVFLTDSTDWRLPWSAPRSCAICRKLEDWNWETIFYGYYRSIFDHCDIIGLKIYLIW